MERGGRSPAAGESLRGFVNTRRGGDRTAIGKEFDKSTLPFAVEVGGGGGCAVACLVWGLAAEAMETVPNRTRRRSAPIRRICLNGADAAGSRRRNHATATARHRTHCKTPRGFAIPGAKYSLLAC